VYSVFVGGLGDTPEFPRHYNVRVWE